MHQQDTAYNTAYLPRGPAASLKVRQQAEMKWGQIVNNNRTDFPDKASLMSYLGAMNRE